MARVVASAAGVGAVLLIQRSGSASVVADAGVVVLGSASSTSVPLAASLLILGIGVIGLGAAGRARGAIRTWRRIPFGAGAFAVGATLLLWQALGSHQEAHVRRAVRLAGRSVHAKIDADLAAAFAALRAMAELDPLEQPDLLRWQQDIALAQPSVPGILALDWMDAALEVRYQSLVEDGIPQPPRRVPSPDGAERALLLGEHALREAVVAPVAGSERERAMRLVVPAFRGPVLWAFVAATVAPRRFLAAALASAAPGYAVRVASGPDELFRGGPRGVGGQGDWTYGEEVPLPGGTVWTLRVEPSASVLAAIDTELPRIVLAAGIFASILLAATLQLARNAALQAEALRHEIEHRRRTEEELKRLSGGLEERIRERTEELAGANAALHFENSLRQAAQTHLARSNEDLRQFAAFVSHELRQPLATMGIWLELLATGARGALTEKQAGYLTKIHASIDRMNGLIAGELAVSQAGTFELVAERVDLSVLVAEVFEEARQTVEATVAFEAASLPVLRGDPAQMRRLFSNLVDNAVKYRRPGVPLIVRIEGDERLHAGPSGQRRMYEIHVRDNGRGFAPEDAEHIFAIFRRRSDDVTQGSGVGLAVCRRIVERHGGSITALGEPGVGATFRIVLPADGHGGAQAFAG